MDFGGKAKTLISQGISGKGGDHHKVQFAHSATRTTRIECDAHFGE